MTRRRRRAVIEPAETLPEARAARVLRLLDNLHRQPRRMTVADHERFRRTLDNPHRDDADLDEEQRQLRRQATFYAIGFLVLAATLAPFLP